MCIQKGLETQLAGLLFTCAGLIEHLLHDFPFHCFFVYFFLTSLLPLLSFPLVR